ncbi:MAG TPA: VWA domain-containing protein [Vicinamibacterales bacterium]|nr:VWA domain-containing protein [Vicinamibacterales bacterium]
MRLSLAAAMVAIAVGILSAQQDVPQVTFKSSVNLVSVAVVVRDGDGRFIKGLKAEDFEIADNGKVRPIVQFQSGEAADARLALLVDSSGSMVVGAKRDRVQLAAHLLVSGFADQDEATVFGFDSSLRRLTPFTRDAGELRSAVSSLVPFGETCMYDAIVDTIRSVETEAPRARAVVLLTDGVDTASVHNVQDAASAAAALDIPVYALGVDDFNERPRFVDRTLVDDNATVNLAELARRTGGTATEANSVAQLSIATRSILTELHHQYMMAFAAGTQPGWHPLTVRVRKGRAVARSRDGYLVH